MLKRKRKNGSWRVLGAALAWVLLLSTGSACTALKGPGTADPGGETGPEVSGVEVKTEDGSDTVIITTAPGELPYSVYKWVDPARVVVDIADTSSANSPETIPVADGLIQDIEVKPILDDNPEGDKMVRVIVNLDRDAEYDIERQGENIVLTLDKSGKAAKTEDLFPDFLAGAESGEETDAAASSLDEWAWNGPEDSAAEQDPDTEAGDLSKPAMFSMTSEGNGNSKLSLNEIPPADSGAESNLLGVKVENEGDLAKVTIEADGEIGDYSSFTMDDPVKLVVDVWGMKNQAEFAKQEINSQGILRLRAGEHDNKLRFVFDVNETVPNYRVDKEGGNLVVTFSRAVDLADSPEHSVETAAETAGDSWDFADADGGADSIELAQVDSSSAWDSSTAMDWGTPEEGGAADEGMSSTPSTSSTPSGGLDWGPALKAPVDPYSSQDAGIAYFDAVKFDYSNKASTIIINSDRPIRREMWNREDNEDEQVVTFFFYNSQVAADQQRSYDTKEFNGPVELFSVFQRPSKPNEVAIVVVLRELAASKWHSYDNKFVIKIENYPGSLGVGGAEGSGMFGPTGDETFGDDQTPSVEEANYVGKTISLDFKNMDILDALRIIAEASNMNIVVGDQVRGNLTIKLEDVPWDQALDIILETKGLDKVQKGTIIRIDTRSNIAKEKAEEAAALEAELKYKKLQIAIIPINYLTASDMKKLIDPLLTKGRGKADADRRTNSIIIRDVPEVVSDARKLIGKLDRPTKQVLIEARMVEATVGVTRQMGVQWGTGVDIGPGTGTPTGVNFPNSVQVGGATLGGAIDPAVNAAGMSAGGGALGMSLGHLTNAVNLDVMLRALEAQEKIKIISSPRVLTLSDETARIQQGVSIPYPPPSIVGGGATGWTFVEATLQLEVTPHVSNTDESITLDVRAANNEPVTVSGSDQPGVSKKEAETTILLKNCETAVIGGIFKIRESNPVTQVPFLGNLPVVGRLFQDRTDESRNEELIIFLTPQIIEPGETVDEAVAIEM